MKNLSEKLFEHLGNLTEVSEDPTIIQKLILRKENNAFGRLVWALIEPTVVSQGGRFIAPSFSEIKPYLVTDIKAEIRLMQKEGWDESTETIARLLLDPAEYDTEVGNYADTTFLEAYASLYTGDNDLRVLVKYEDDVVNYLEKEIQRNYRMLITLVAR